MRAGDVGDRVKDPGRSGERMRQLRADRHLEHRHRRRGDAGHAGRVVGNQVHDLPDRFDDVAGRARGHRDARQVLIALLLRDEPVGDQVRVVLPPRLRRLLRLLQRLHLPVRFAELHATDFFRQVQQLPLVPRAHRREELGISFLERRKQLGAERTHLARRLQRALEEELEAVRDWADSSSRRRPSNSRPRSSIRVALDRRPSTKYPHEGRRPSASPS